MLQDTHTSPEMKTCITSMMCFCNGNNQKTELKVDPISVLSADLLPVYKNSLYLSLYAHITNPLLSVLQVLLPSPERTARGERVS